MSERSEVARHERIIDAIEAKDLNTLPESEREEGLQVSACITLMLVPGNTQRAIVKTLVNEHGVSEMTAYRRIAVAKAILGDTLVANRKVDAMILFQRAEHIYTKAIETDQLEVALTAIAQMVKIKGLDRDDLSALDPSKLAAMPVELRLPADITRFFRHLRAKGVIDFGEVIPEAEIIEQKQLPPA